MKEIYQKKAVLYCGGFILPDKNAAAHRVLANGKILKKMGYEVFFNGVYLNNVDVEIENETYNGFHFFSDHYPRAFPEWVRYLTSIENQKILIKKIKESYKIDFLIAYNFPSIALNRLRIFCKSHNIKIISDCTEWESVPFKNPVKFLIKSFDTFYRMRIVHQKLDGLIVISSYLRKFYLKNVKEILMIPPLVDKNESKWSLPSNFNKNEIVFCYAGSPSLKKDKVGLVVDAFSKFCLDSKVVSKLRIVGISKKEYIRMFNPKGIDSSVERKIKFLGRISHIQSIKEVSNANFSIFFRDNTRKNNAGFPTKFVESISSGTPVITNNTSDLSEYMSKSEFGFMLRNKDIKTIVANLNYISKIEIDKIFNMKDVCYKSNLFHYEKYFNRFQFFISQVLSKST
ncbi:MAG: hypothetical protein CMG63_02980 [Candidatus Marinimicrobia bacterium]|nr:hypothetical protein [Candidatus Neomarinimicrobiota bacterium]